MCEPFGGTILWCESTRTALDLMLYLTYGPSVVQLSVCLVVLGARNPSSWNSSILIWAVSRLQQPMNSWSARETVLNTDTCRSRWHTYTREAEMYQKYNDLCIMDLEISSAGMLFYSYLLWAGARVVLLTIYRQKSFTDTSVRRLEAHATSTCGMTLTTSTVRILLSF